MNSCPSEGQLARLLRDEVSADERLALFDHVERCRVCEEVLRCLTEDCEVGRWVELQCRGREPDASEKQTVGSLRDAIEAGAELQPSSSGSVSNSEDGFPRTDHLDPGSFLRRLALAPPPDDVFPEAALQGPVAPAGYAVLSVLGRGGMGIVYQARQLRPERIVALKMILRAEHASVDERQRFLGEAEAAARLQHPHIVQILEVGEWNGRPYFSQEFCGGGTLQKRLNESPLSPTEAASLAELLARAVDHAHRHGIVHRDLKPSNILLTDEGVPKISDFGLAKRLDVSGLTASGAVLGTPQYMAPEQARGDSCGVSPAADIYALGAVLYAMLTGRPPFHGATTADTLLQTLHDEPVAPGRLQPGLPSDLETICLKCLEKEPEKRYPSALALAEDLGRYQRGEPILARPVSAVGRAWRWCRRHRAVSALTAVALFLLLAGSILSTWFALLAGSREREALEKAEEERQARRDADAQRTQARRHAATVALDHALSFLEKGDRGRGLLWLCRALEEAPAEDQGLQLAIRGNLSHWRDGLWSLQTILPHQGRVRSAAFSPRGKMVVTTSWDAPPQLCDVAQRRIRSLPLHHPGSVGTATFHPDGALLLTGGADGTARLWDVLTGKPRLQPLQHPGGVWAVAFSPDGQTILTGSQDGAARRWDTGSGKSIGEPLRHRGEVFAATFSPDGKMILTGSRDQTAQLWDAVTGKPLGQPLQHQASVKAVAFSPDSRTLLSGSEDGMVRLWDVATGQSLGTPFQHLSPVRTVAFRPDGASVLTGSTDRVARLWDLTRRDTPLMTFTHQGEVGAVAFSPDGATILSGDDAALRFWNASPGRACHPLLHHEGEVRSVAFSPNGRMVATGSGKPGEAWGKACLWDIAQMRRTTVFEEKRPVTAVAFSPDGKVLLTGNRDGTARLWDCGSGRPIGLPLLHEDREKDAATVNAVAFSPDGRFVLTGSANRRASLWERQSGKRDMHLLRHQGQVMTVGFSPDSRIALTGGADRLVRLWDVHSGEPIGDPLQHQDVVFSATFSGDGSTILTGSYHGATLWDMTKRLRIRSVLPHDREVRAVALSPDGTLALTGCGDGTARIWEARSGKPLGPPLRHQAGIKSVAFHPDGTRVLTGSADQTARLWQVFPPVPGAVEYIALWMQIVTGLELHESGELRVMDAETWQKRCTQLRELGGRLVS